MYFLLRFAAFAALLVSFALAGITQPALAADKCVIANSHYTGWEPIWLAKDLGLLKKWGQKFGVELDVTDPMDYGESINQFTAGQFCALAVTNMDALIGPAAGGIETIFFVVGDTSHGNDGLLWKAAKRPDIKSIVGKKVVLVENSVSHYFLWRAAQVAKFDFKKVAVVNAASEMDVKNAFRGEGSIIVTWNPILMTARQEKGAHLLFDSSQIPGEIIDGIVVNGKLASENARKAIAGAWYEVMAIIAQKGTPAYKDAVARMAKGVEQTVAEFEAQLATTALFFKASEAVAFSKNPKLSETMDHVRGFSAELGLFGRGKTKDAVGIKLPDGLVLGDPKNVRLVFDVVYMQLAADGKL